MKVIFLDRDGVVNEDYGYVSRVENFKFREGIFPLLRSFRINGYELCIITNQSGIGRGFFELEDLKVLNRYLISKLQQNGITLLDLLYCPHAPDDDCSCRKPKPEMVNRAVEKYTVSIKESWFIGDKESDIMCANNAGIFNTIKIGQKTDRRLETHNVENLEEIKRLIC